MTNQKLTYNTMPHSSKPSSKQSLRIGIFVDDFYPTWGGNTRSVELQIEQLVAMGHDVTLFAPRINSTPPALGKFFATPVWYIPGTPSFLCFLRFSSRTAQEISDEYKFDIVHSQTERGALFLAARIAKLQGIPHLQTFHTNYAGMHQTAKYLSLFNTAYMAFAAWLVSRIRSDMSTRPPISRRFLATLEPSWGAQTDWRSLMRIGEFIDGFTSPAPFIVDAIHKAYGNALYGKVVMNGIVTTIFTKTRRTRESDGKTRFIVHCRLSSEKRIDLIVKAFAKLNRSDAELYIVGRGTDTNKLKRLSSQLVKNGKVVFTGIYTDRKDLAGELVNADVAVLASYHFDTQAMVLAEAASVGLPIIYCDERLTFGVSTDNALLVDPTVDAFAEAMQWCVSHPEERAVMSKASIKLVPRFAPEVMEEQFVGIYNDLIQKKTR